MSKVVSKCLAYTQINSNCLGLGLSRLLYIVNRWRLMFEEIGVNALHKLGFFSLYEGVVDKLLS